MGDLLENEVITLILQQQFFLGHLLQQFRRVSVDKSSGIRTLAVMINEDLQPHLLVNKEFYSSGDFDSTNPTAQTWGLITAEKIAVLSHECCHILNRHLLRVESRNHYVFNVAGDLAINQFIKDLPKGMLCPECNIFIRKKVIKCPVCKMVLNIDEHKFECLDINDFRVNGEKITLQHDGTMESYYDIIYGKIPKITIEVGGSITGGRESSAKEAFDAGGSGKRELDGVSGVGCDVDVNGVKMPMPMDGHDMWGTGGENNEMAHEKIKEMVQKAVSKTNEKTQGNMPAWLQKLIDECLEHKTIKWKTELRRFWGWKEFSHFITTRKRINRRFPITFPGYKIKRKAHFVFIADSSGSVSDEEFVKMAIEMNTACASGVSITYIECDMDITYVEEVKKVSSKRKNNKIKRYGYGGTDFRPPFKFIEDKTYRNGQGKVFHLKKKVDGIVYLTDGAGSYPNKIPAPTIWVMTKNHDAHGWSAKIGKKIVMED